MTATPSSEVQDAELLRQAKSGDLEAFEALVLRHERRVYTLALRILKHEQDAQDVTQEAFAKAIEHLNGFREEASFLTWLLRIAANAALKVIRKRKGLPSQSLDAATDEREDEPIPHPEYIADWRDTPDKLLQERETRRILDDALEVLDEKHRTVFLLRDVEGFSIAETAQMLGLSESNVKVRLLRARLLLRERLTKELGDPTRRLAPHSHD